MTILLLNPPNEKGFIRSGRWARRTRGNQSWYPIWLAYCTALLEREGFNTHLVDAGTQGYSVAETTAIVQRLNPDLIAYYWSFDRQKEDLDYADTLGKKWRVVLVGPWSLCSPDALNGRTNLRLMTYGEFDHTVLELAIGYSFSDVKGLIWKGPSASEVIHRNDPRLLCNEKALDMFPFVTDVYRRHLDIEMYRQTSLRHPFVDLLTARGCAHRCSYCVWGRAFQGGPSYRARSIEDVMRELWYIDGHLPDVKQVFFQDDTLPQKHAQQLSQAIIDEGIRISWGGYARAELDFDTLALMKQSSNGRLTLHVGYEFPIQKYLDMVCKDITVERMKRFGDDVAKLGIWTSATFMIHPQMTREEVEFEIRWAKSIKPKRINLIAAQAYPGTPFAENCGGMNADEMRHLEKMGFTDFYLKNPRFWYDVATDPASWRDVLRDAVGLIGFLREA